LFTGDPFDGKNNTVLKSVVFDNRRI